MVYELQRSDSAFKFKDLSQRELLNRSKLLENGIILLCLSNYVREIWVSHDSECVCFLYDVTPVGWQKFTDNPEECNASIIRLDE
jgi:hypothetical protein